MKDKKIKTLFISSWYPNRRRPFLGIFVRKHAEAVSAYCSVAAVFACADEREGVEEKTENGVETYVVYYRKSAPGVPVVGGAVNFFRYMRAWRRAVGLYKKKNGKPDIIHANIVFPASIVATWYSFVWKIPYLITEHWTGYFEQDGRYRGFIVPLVSRIAVRRASAITTVSEALKQKMQKAKLKNNYYVVSNIVDTDLFTPSAESHEGMRFLHISFQDGDHKNVPGIIRAFATFRKTHENSTLTLIVGEGEEAEGFRNLCASLGLSGSVTFLGWKTPEQLVSVYRGADVFVLFSKVETQAIVLPEAMCCGKPVISSRCGAPEEYVTAENGLLVDVGNEAQLAEAMDYMAKNKNLYKAETVRATVAGTVNRDAVGKKFLEIYNSILGIK